MVISEILIRSIAVAFWVIGVYEVTQEGEPLHFIRRALDRVCRQSWWYKPILDCPACMSSFHSLYIWFLFPLPLLYLAAQIIITYGIIRFIRNQWYQ
jgi:hypothetical protein